MKNFKKIFICLIIFSIQCLTKAQTYTFEQVQTEIKNIFYPAIDIGDFDNDGYDDIIIAGAIDTNNDYKADKSILYIYRNDNGVFTELADANLYGLHLASVKFIDIDNDGDLDIVVMGQNYENIAKHRMFIYENDNNTFKIKQELQGYIYGSIDCGDFNNDGYIDFVITGFGVVTDGKPAEQVCKIFENQKNGTFKEIETNFPGVMYGCAKFIDYNNDGYLDLVTMGKTDGYPDKVLATYKNENGIFTEDQIITPDALGNCWFDFIDLDNDGYVELIAHGQDAKFNKQIFIYKNNNGTFTKEKEIPAVSNNVANSMTIGDYNNDGETDVIVIGSNSEYEDLTLIFKNTNGTFEFVEEGIEQVGSSGVVAFIDYNNDNNLDLITSGFKTLDIIDDDGEQVYTTITTLYKNNCPTINQKPEPPTELNLTKDGNNYTFSWNNGKDDHTNPSNLKYLLTVSSANSEGDIMKYIVKGNSWQLKNIDKEIDNWSIQTIDGANVKSDKNTSIVTNINNNKISSTKNNFNIYPNPATNFIKIDNFNNLDINVIKLIESTGKTIKTININNNNSKIDIDIQNINNGLYILEINYQDSIENFKFIKH